MLVWDKAIIPEEKVEKVETEKFSMHDVLQNEAVKKRIVAGLENHFSNVSLHCGSVYAKYLDTMAVFATSAGRSIDIHVGVVSGNKLFVFEWQYAIKKAIEDELGKVGR